MHLYAEVQELHKQYGDIVRLALRNYEPRVQAYTDQLMQQLSKRENSPVNVTDWFNFYSFDVMGDMAWGKSFNMLRDGIKHYFMTSLHADMTSVGLFSHLVWLFPIFKATPILNKESKKFWIWVNNQVDERKKLSQNPKALQALQKEVDDLYASTDNIDAMTLSKLRYMDAVINETLRLHPPVPSGLQRMTPPEGLQIDQTFIPGNTILQIPSFTMYRGM
ncbi:hypothetical protein KJ359_005335 [Pestalotiopsis sp. 9143b]|nr:hypothetical protein KJ359_005335 [Pestalotiopsis sp. 9143b]